MKLFQIILNVILVSSAFWLNSCTTEIPASPGKTYGPYYLSGALKYIYFEPGTWWVYQDSATGVRDSIVVTYSNRDTLTFEDTYDGTSGNTVIREFVEWKAKSILTGYDYYYFIKNPNVNKNTNSATARIFNLQRTKSKPGDPHAESFIFYSPFNTTYNFAPIAILSSDTMITIDNTSYGNLVAFRTELDWTSGNYETDYYWSPQYGIVLIRNYHTNTTTYLIKAHIVRSL